MSKNHSVHNMHKIKDGEDEGEVDSDDSFLYSGESRSDDSNTEEIKKKRRQEVLERKAKLEEEHRLKYIKLLNKQQNYKEKKDDLVLQFETTMRALKFTNYWIKIAIIHKLMGQTCKIMS